MASVPREGRAGGSCPAQPFGNAPVSRSLNPVGRPSGSMGKTVSSVNGKKARAAAILCQTAEDQAVLSRVEPRYEPSLSRVDPAMGRFFVLQFVMSRRDHHVEVSQGRY